MEKNSRRHSPGGKHSPIPPKIARPKSQSSGRESPAKKSKSKPCTPSTPKSPEKLKVMPIVTVECSKEDMKLKASVVTEPVEGKKDKGWNQTPFFCR